MFGEYLLLFFIFLLIAVLLAIAIYITNINISFLKNAEILKAIILKKNYFLLTIIFKNKNDKKIKVTFFNLFNFLYKKNQIIDVLYLSSNNTIRIKIKSFLSMWIVPIFLLIVTNFMFYIVYKVLLIN